MQTVEIKLPDGQTKQLILPDLSPEQIKKLGHDIMIIAGICRIQKRNQYAKFEPEIKATLEQFTGDDGVSPLHEAMYYQQQDNRRQWLLKAGQDFYPRLLEALIEVLKSERDSRRQNLEKILGRIHTCLGWDEPSDK